MATSALGHCHSGRGAPGFSHSRYAAGSEPVSTYQPFPSTGARCGNCGSVGRQVVPFPH
jgi:hypothetical protein